MNLYWAQIPTADWGVFVIAPSRSRAITLAHGFGMAEGARRSDWRARKLGAVEIPGEWMEQVVAFPYGRAYQLIKAMGYSFGDEGGAS